MRILRHPQTYRLTLLLMLVSLTLATQNCDCQRSSRSGIPSTAQKRLSSIVGSIPAETGGVGVIGNLETLRDTGDKLESNLDDIIPVAGMVERNVHQRFGINMYNAESWKKAGIAPDGAVAVADLGTRPVLLAYYENRQDFEKHLTERIQTSFGIEGAPSSKTVGGHPLKIVGEQAGRRVAWGYRDRLAVVGFPPTDSNSDAATVTSTVQQVLETKPKQSLASRETFERFRSFASDYTSFFFLDTDNLADRELGGETTDPTVASSARYMKQNFDGLGGVLEPTDSGLNAHLWLGLAPDVSEAMTKLQQQVSETSWPNLATSQTMMGLRFGYPPGPALEAALQQSSERQRRAIRRQLQRAGDSLEMGIFFYGFGPNLSLADLRGNVMKTLRQTGLIVAADFADSNALRTLFETLGEANGFLNHRKLKTDEGSTVESIDVLAFTEGESPGMLSRMIGGWNQLPVRFYAHEGRFVASTTAIGEASMRSYLEGSREDAGSLANSESLDLGASFASEPKLSGFYLNVVRAKAVLQDKVPPLPSINRVLNKLQELLITMELRDRAAVLDLQLDRTPKK